MSNQVNLFAVNPKTYRTLAPCIVLHGFMENTAVFLIVGIKSLEPATRLTEFAHGSIFARETGSYMPTAQPGPSHGSS